MQAAIADPVEDEQAPGAAPALCILIVDDSRVQRKILGAQLSRTGYRVLEAASAEEALEISRTHGPDLVISDWVMPGMSGPEFCTALRGDLQGHYVYFILLTSKSDTAEIASGLEGGADDFLTKPVNGDELRARISAGRRILNMERELTCKNRLLNRALGELQGLYDSVNRDLIEARKLQQSLVKEHHRDFGSAEVDLLLQPSGHIGGDLVGFFPINAGRVGIFSIDVSGHGITSALMTARIAGHLSGNSPEQNMALIPGPDGAYEALPPHQLAEQLNRFLLADIQTENYLTLAYADLDLRSGRVLLVQAGHPHPLVQRGDGQIEYLGRGGLPVGLIEGARYEAVETILTPGDRLLLVSDGITEAADQNGAQLGEAGLTALMQSLRGISGAETLDRLVDAIGRHAGADFGDDVSAALISFHGPDGDGLSRVGARRVAPPA